MISIWPGGGRGGTVSSGWIRPAIAAGGLGLAGMTVDGRPDPAFVGEMSSVIARSPTGCMEAVCGSVGERGAARIARRRPRARVLDVPPRRCLRQEWVWARLLASASRSRRCFELCRGARARIVRAAQRAGRFTTWSMRKSSCCALDESWVVQKGISGGTPARRCH